MAEKKTKQTFNTKLYECAGDDSDKLRPLFQCVHFENGYAFVTDGIVAVKQTLSFQSILNPENLDGKSIHKNSFKQIMTFETARANDEVIECWNENGQHVYFEYYDRIEGEKMPNIEHIMKPKGGLTQLSFIGIEPDHLKRIKSALYCPPPHVIRLQFTGIDRPIMIDVPGIDEQQAILMPIVINGTLF